MIALGAIQDGKTIMRLQHAAIAGLEHLRHTCGTHAVPRQTGVIAAPHPAQRKR
jgi:hypothetical protein